MDVAGEVLSVVRNDPYRGRTLIEKMLIAAESEDDLSRIGIDPLETLLRLHGAALHAWVAEAAESRVRFRFALKSCWPSESIQDVWERLDSAKGRTHTYWTMGFRLRCQRPTSLDELLDAKLQHDVVGGETRVDGKDRVLYFDYWARDRDDAARVGERLVQTLLAELSSSRCRPISVVGPELTWSGTRPGIDRPARPAV